jgi:hypothetical protein
MPQVLPVLQLEAALLLNENVLPPLDLDAKVDSFFLICGLPQLGQITSLIALVLRTSSSNGWPHSLHSNSKIGIVLLHYFYIFCSADSLLMSLNYLPPINIDAKTTKRLQFFKYRPTHLLK